MPKTIISNSGHTAYGLKDFLLDTEADVVNLPISGVVPGSKAFVIETSQYYMFNHLSQWVKVAINGTGGGGGGTSYIFDGGSIDPINSEGGDVDQVAQIVYEGGNV